MQKSVFLLCISLYPLSGETGLFKVFDMGLRADNFNDH